MLPMLMHRLSLLALIVAPLVALLSVSCAYAQAGINYQHTDVASEVALTAVYDGRYAQNFSQCRQHFVMGVPPDLGKYQHLQGQQLYPLCYHGFASAYAALGKISLYSAHYLTRSRIDAAKLLPRTDSFRSEPRLPAALQVSPKDYQGRAYDRGHLAPNADMSDVQMQYDSFALANIIPQNSSQNRELWRHIEAHTRKLGAHYDGVYVLTGSAFHGECLAQMADVLVPSHVYKAIYIPSQQSAAVYYAPNDASGVYHLIDLKSFYALTGINAFPSLGMDVSFKPNLFAIDTQGLAIAQKKPPDSLGQTLVKMWRAFWRALVAYD